MSRLAFYALPLDEQEDYIAAWDAERHACPKCGGDPAVCSDPERPWYPQRQVCYATRERRAAERLFELLHKDTPFHDGSGERWAKEASRAFPVHFADGVTISVALTDLNPDDDFLGTGSVAEQAPAE